MADEKFAREYGHHLVEEVLNGRMTRRQLLVRASVFGLSATVIAQLLAACGSSGGTSASPSAAASGSALPAVVTGGTMKAVIPPPLKALDPVTIYDQGGIVLVYQIAEYLIDLTNQNALKPKLAVSWTPNKKGNMWTFKLRQNVKWHNGKPFEAAELADEDEVVVISWFEWQRVHAESGYHEIDSYRALWMLNSLDCQRLMEARHFVSELRLNSFPLDRTKDHEVLEIIRQALNNRRLVAIRVEDRLRKMRPDLGHDFRGFLWAKRLNPL